MKTIELERDYGKYGKCKNCDGQIIDNPRTMKIGPIIIVASVIIMGILSYLIHLRYKHLDVYDFKEASPKQIIFVTFGIYFCFISFVPAFLYDNFGKIFVCSKCLQEYRRKELNLWQIKTSTFILCSFLVAVLIVGFFYMVDTLG